MAKSRWDKKAKILAVICAVLLVLSAVFCALWAEERKSARDTMVSLCRASAAYSAQSLENHANGGEAYLYTAAVADYNNFLCLFYQVYGTDMNAEFLIMNEVYGHLVMQPDIAKTWSPLLIHILENLSADLTDAHAHEELSRVRNALVEGLAATEEDLAHSHEH